MRTKKAIYSELVKAKASTTIICVWQRLKGRERSGVKKGKVSGTF